MSWTDQKYQENVSPRVVQLEDFEALEEHVFLLTEVVLSGADDLALEYRKRLFLKKIKEGL